MELYDLDAELARVLSFAGTIGSSAWQAGGWDPLHAG